MKGARLLIIEINNKISVYQIGGGEIFASETDSFLFLLLLVFVKKQKDLMEIVYLSILAELSVGIIFMMHNFNCRIRNYTLKVGIIRLVKVGGGGETTSLYFRSALSFFPLYPSLTSSIFFPSPFFSTLLFLVAIIQHFRFYLGENIKTIGIGTTK